MPEKWYKLIILFPPHQNPFIPFGQRATAPPHKPKLFFKTPYYNTKPPAAPTKCQVKQPRKPEHFVKAATFSA